ncbi:MAG: hypothetical protein ACI4C7_04830 [Clostridia bacterium]
MTQFSFLAPTWQFLLAGLLFFSTMSELFVCIYQYRCTGKLKNCLIDACLFVLLLSMLSFTVTAAHIGEGVFFIPLPWGCFPIFTALIFAHSVRSAKKCYKESKEKLSPYSVKQALDNLNSGICFADDNGKIVLINHTMGKLASVLIGNYPQMLSELQKALKAQHNGGCVIPIDNSGEIYRFPNGRIWRFQTVPLAQKDFKGYTQTTAQDITELYNANVCLREDNEKLKKINRKMRKMYNRLADRMREQENLNLKMKIHDDIGTSLITISKIMDEGINEDIETQLTLLQNAVSYFSGHHNIITGTFEDVQRKAAEIKVELSLDGYIPQNDVLEKLIVSAAGECVTNCVHHAHGSQVNVKITEQNNFYKVVITNNGKAPKEKIVEGGGLSALRKSVESAGGEMYTSHSPVFALILNLPGKEKELYD